MRDKSNALEALRARIRDSEELTDEDRDVLIAFSDEMYLLSSTYSNHRHEKLLRHCTRIGEEVGGLADALQTEEAAKEIVRWINRTYENEETNRDYRIALRVCARRTTEGDEIPESVGWVPSGTSKNYDPAPKPANMLHWEDDVLPMIETTHNSRDAALIAVAWDSGARSGELQALQVGDVTDHRHGLQITVQGKTGQRTVTLFTSPPYLKQWLQNHPDRKNATAPLWSKLHEGDELSYNGFTKILRRAAKNADVEKPVTLTNFRKSSASYLASRGVNQATLEAHHGWKRGSRVAARYVSVFSDASDTELARAHGLDVSEEEPDPIAPLECPRCGRETPREEEFCVWCHQAVDPGAAQTIRDRELSLRKSVMRLIRDDPGLVDEVQQAQDLLTVLEDRPDLADDAEQFRQALVEFDGEH
ncbi:site-specific integrase [Haloferax sulfurifontis]|uniref:Integrase family protein n=1 Tax=Haloferax sulfurifontis ATCC BAA-897 TaxID=662480 RepID=M0I9Y0_9EURY|nr:site-specific integrase [Haloferax sulfurifontis]ELZ92648.1 integrase family protein [Haloferax sulfurifontis ATCC BAA-897]